MSFPRGHSEQERLNASFNGHGYSAGLEISTGGPLSPGPALSPASPRSPRSPQEERQLRQTIRLIAAAVIFGLLVATMIALLAATVIRWVFARPRLPLAVAGWPEPASSGCDVEQRGEGHRQAMWTANTHQWLQSGGSCQCFACRCCSFTTRCCLAQPPVPSPLNPPTAARSCRREGGAGCLIPKQKVPLPWGGASLWPVGKTVSRIAFGSCAAYDARPQPVWEEVSHAVLCCAVLCCAVLGCSRCTKTELPKQEHPPHCCMLQRMAHKSTGVVSCCRASYRRSPMLLSGSAIFTT